ncbi:hypothetical protein AB1Y20_023292 [Prymnesium parvum]|uniref:SGNH hydrolase-type esterase domain-containing protein n=1 Tax=Prymnesium parvum TaxID=97485 RepID=A0AB34JDN3_PRYPA
MDALGSEALARQFFSLHSREAATAIDAVRPSLLQEAHVVRSGPAMLYRWQKLFKHLEQPRCCLHILVLGGSVACGSFSSLFGRRKGVTPATFNTTYAVHLERYLNSHRSSCCQESHLVENRCFPGAGSSYINSNFERVVEEPPLRARRQWDLIIVDVGPNDFNAFVLDDLRRGHGMNGMQASIVEWETEALIRRISTMQHPVPVMFMENAWFDSARCSEPFGAFNVHLPVLKHYGVPTLHMIGPLARICGANETTPSASRQTAAVQVGNRTSSTPAELCRSRMLADALHLSAQGHLIGAFFLVNVLILERLRSGLNRVSTRDLPSPLASIADLEDLIMAPSTLLDFSNPAGRWIEAITKINGWQWRVDRKLPSGMYEHVNFTTGVGQLYHVTAGQLVRPTQHEVRLVVERKRLGSVGGNVVSIGLSMASCSRGAETLGLRRRLAGQEGRPLAARRRPTPTAWAALLLRPSVGAVACSTQQFDSKFERPILARRGA